MFYFLRSLHKGSYSNLSQKHQTPLFFTVVIIPYLTLFNSSLYQLLFFKAITFRDLT